LAFVPLRIFLQPGTAKESRPTSSRNQASVLRSGRLPG